MCLSSSKNMAAEEVFFRMTFLFAYLLVRVAICYEAISFENVIKTLYLISITFSLYLVYVVFITKSAISLDGRLLFNFVHPNYLASLLLILSAPAIYFIYKSLLEGGRKLYLFAHLISLALSFLLILITSSRGAMLGFALGVLPLIYFNWREAGVKMKYALIVIALVFIAALVFILPYRFERLTSVFNAETVVTAGSRWHLWSGALKTFGESPVFGYGPGTAHLYQMQKHTGLVVYDTHDIFLEKLCDGGIAGFIIYFAPFFLIAAMAVKCIREKLKTSFKANNQNAVDFNGTGNAIDSAMLFMLIAVMINSIFTPFSGFVAGAVFLYIFIAVYLSCAGIPVKARNNLKEKTDAKKWMAGAVPVCLIIVLIMSVILVILGGYNYTAERANENGTALYCAANKIDDFVKSLAYFDLAVKYNSENPAYLLNKAFNLLTLQMVECGYIVRNTKTEEALALIERASIINPFERKMSAAKNFIKSKLENNPDIFFKNLSNGISFLEKAAFANPHDLFSIIADVYGEDSLNKFNELNQHLRTAYIQNANLLNFNQADGKNTSLQNIIDYLIVTLQAGVNIDIKDMRTIIERGLKNAARAVTGTANFLPGVDYSQHSYQNREYQKKNDKSLYLLPLIYKYSDGYDSDKTIDEIGKLINDSNSATEQENVSSIASVIKYFIYRNSSAEIELLNSVNVNGGGKGDNFKGGNKQNRNLLTACVELSKGNFSKCVEIASAVDNRLSNEMQVITAWAYYKMNDFTNARAVLYSKITLIQPPIRHFSYKKTLLFAGDFIEFYYHTCPK